WRPAVTREVAQYRGARVLDAADAAERHGDVELLLDHVQCLAHARLAARAEPVDEGAAKEHRFRAERERFQQALAAADAAVEPHGDAIADGVSDLRQRADGRRSAV